MIKRLLLRMIDYPPILSVVRRIIEANYRGKRAVLQRERELLHGSLLDVPCGTGDLCISLPPVEYTGIDNTQKYIVYARERYPERTFLVMDAMDMKFPDVSFDTLLVVGFLHHLDDQEMQRVLREMHRVLKRGGTMLLIEDHPTRSRWNLLGRLLQNLDEGEHIRDEVEYREALRHSFTVLRSYPMITGVWDYTVFVLQKQ